MHIRLSKIVFNRMTRDELDNVGRTQSNLRGLNYLDVSLLEMDSIQIGKLRASLIRMKGAGTRKLNPLIADIDRWNAIINGNGNVSEEHPVTMRDFSDLLTEYLRTVPGHRVYIQSDSKEWLAYYVNYVEYEREIPADRNYGYKPAHVELHLLYWMLGTSYSHIVTLHNEDLNGFNVSSALATKGIFAETDGLRADYMMVKDKFDAVFEEIGCQYTTEGFGVSMDDRYSSWSRIPMMHEGVASKVVIDVVNESTDKTGSNRAGRARTNFWNMKRPEAIANNSSEDLSLNRRAIFPDTISEPPEIPIHPFVPVYHLDLHRRFRVNVMELQEYEYDKALGERLVLPDITKRLIDVLVSQGKIAFRDIIEGKGAGACILLGGPPGVGKTLTAQVFAEATERPLLAVQAAQLGINPETIEGQLRKILQLGSRWNAVVLLDEADVYIGKRGSDLIQNSIVAAFLRILEQHSSTIFMTTNRANDVDDAVLSRCLARINYDNPDTDSQRQIWKVMSELNSVNLSDPDIDEIVERHSTFSGRDIKQIVKLAALWASRHNESVSPSTVDFVSEFLPTLIEA